MRKIKLLFCLLSIQTIKSDSAHMAFADSLTFATQSFISKERDKCLDMLKNESKMMAGHKVLGYAKLIGQNWCVITKDDVFFVDKSVTRLLYDESKPYLFVCRERLEHYKSFLKAEGAESKSLDKDEASKLLNSQLKNISWSEILSAKDVKFLEDNMEGFANAIEHVRMKLNDGDTPTIDEGHKRILCQIVDSKEAYRLQNWTNADALTSFLGLGEKRTASVTPHEGSVHDSDPDEGGSGDETDAGSAASEKKK
ncbi:MAG: hypothetical protein H6845_02645 [Alphaproteobacteria bacterium]|nr:MAG: hypothetical protein H6845_02645 [Alphaproteobacteria bacterium]